jgi:hypothetical protein
MSFPLNLNIDSAEGNYPLMEGTLRSDPLSARLEDGSGISRGTTGRNPACH